MVGLEAGDHRGLHVVVKWHCRLPACVRIDSSHPENTVFQTGFDIACSVCILHMHIIPRGNSGM
jgi:hypothetical protein